MYNNATYEPHRIKPPFKALARRLYHRAPSFSDPDDDPPFTRLTECPPRPASKPAHATKKKNQGGSIKQPELVRSDLPFNFRYSYSKTDPAWRPIGFREPTRFSPFGPGRLDRPWDGVAAAAARGEGAGAAATSREEVLGEPLAEEEVAQLVERYRHSDCSRQINLGGFQKLHSFLMLLARKSIVYKIYSDFLDCLID